VSIKAGELQVPAGGEDDVMIEGCGDELSPYRYVIAGGERA
jgi:hypothetical protein